MKALQYNTFSIYDFTRSNNYIFFLKINLFYIYEMK